MGFKQCVLDTCGSSFKSKISIQGPPPWPTGLVAVSGNQGYKKTRTFCNKGLGEHLFDGNIMNLTPRSSDSSKNSDYNREE